MYPMVVLYWFTYTHKYHTLIQHFFLMKESNGTKYAFWGMLLWWSPLMMINGFQFQNKIAECFVRNSLILLYQNIFQIYFCINDVITCWYDIKQTVFQLNHSGRLFHIVLFHVSVYYLGVLRCNVICKGEIQTLWFNCHASCFKTSCRMMQTF